MVGCRLGFRFGLESGFGAIKGMRKGKKGSLTCDMVKAEE